MKKENNINHSKLIVGEKIKDECREKIKKNK